MSSLRALQKNWDGLAQRDPLAAICTDPQKERGRWTHDEFFETGRQEVHTVFEYLRSLGISVDQTSPALDFGCGVGRLTAALSEHFVECVGVDISPTMIQLANHFHKENRRCRFVLNDRDDLRNFGDASFGFIYSSIVLQHMKNSLARNYLCELVRLLKPAGVLVFQIPDRNLAPLIQKVRHVVGLRRKINWLLRRKTPHMEMYCLPERHIRELLSGLGMRIVDVKLTNSTEVNFNGRLRFLEQEPLRGFVSKQYCALKV
ncbi:MAG TPA: class I SAM-dependent methyltransferase [Candidatus Angelobacter sp.]